MLKSTGLRDLLCSSWQRSARLSALTPIRRDARPPGCQVEATCMGGLGAGRWLASLAWPLRHAMLTYLVGLTCHRRPCLLQPCCQAGGWPTPPPRAPAPAVGGGGCPPPPPPPRPDRPDKPATCSGHAQLTLALIWMHPDTQSNAPSRKQRTAITSGSRGYGARPRALRSLQQVF